MPELPEVETTRRGVEPHLLGVTVQGVEVREPRLRWPVPEDLVDKVSGQCIESVARRAKYLLLGFKSGVLLLHLGMSGSLRLVSEGVAPGKHDHLDLLLETGLRLRLTDPRRFGAVLWLAHPAEASPLLSRLGPEPLSGSFGGEWLYQRSRGRRVAVKPFIMDQAVVVGVGNIYACEALFRAGIDPRRPAGRISRKRYEDLSLAIKQVLERAIEQGGTTLRDFVGSDGRPGYFAQELQVYGRAGESCPSCGGVLLSLRLGQRNTVYCPACQR